MINTRKKTHADPLVPSALLGEELPLTIFDAIVISADPLG